jgi:tetratricopeptide (TPR) repeat protein
MNLARSMVAGLIAAGMAGVGMAGAAYAFKDVGPKSAACDAKEPGSAAWTACVGSANAGKADAELFYAGYWLARTGHYEEALRFLGAAKVRDERVLTYIGFATRKLGRTDEAMGFYREALGVNPNYSVARAYMGEGFLALGKREKAIEQLDEIAQRSGKASAEYGDLVEHIAHYDAELSRKG